MTKEKISWKSLIIPCCYKPDNEEKLLGNKRCARKQSSFQRLSVSDFDHPSSPISANDLSNSFIGAKLHKFTFNELREATHNFASCNLLGEGGFGPVYKGFVVDDNNNNKPRQGLKPQPVAVKVLDTEGLQGHREWLTEIIFLGQLRHPHLVKLIGYCWEDEYRLLVYEYMARGSLENQLFGKCSVALSWGTRMKIAVGAAKGLAFLHEGEKPVIYRDFKASNILLDSDYTAKLSDFGLAKDGPEGDDTHVSTRIMGTHGYAAPEYIMTGHLTTMSDVYSFRVVLLELLTGKRSMDKSRPSGRQNLVEWTRPLLRDPNKISRLMDRKLEGLYSTKGAQTAALVAYKCLSHSAKPRPTMADVVKILEPLQDYKDSSQEQNKPLVLMVHQNPNLINGCDSNGEVKNNWKRRIELRKVIASYSDTALYKRQGKGKQFLKHYSK